MKNKGYLILGILALIILLTGCQSREKISDQTCEKGEALYCEDFEGVDPSLGGSQLVVSTAIDQWWVTRDDDQDSLFQDFPQAGRSRSNMIIVGAEPYQNQSKSILYTREIDLRLAAQASLRFNLIYKTERHWDGLVVFAIIDGVAGVKDPDKWVVISPQDGYPDSVLFNGIVIPGYSGISAGWIEQEMDLSEFLGKRIIIGFYFTADEFLDQWGVGLDDIVISADGGSVANQMAGLTAQVIPEILLDQDPLIAPELPRANTLIKTQCVMKETQSLGANQRVIIKAINETGDRVLVLHPVTGSFCWIDQTNIWIDGEMGLVPSLTEKSRNTYYPINNLAHTPAISGPGCEPVFPDSLPVYLQSALVENGRITTLQFKPMTATGDPLTPTDPRISQDQILFEKDLKRSPGGEIQLEINGIKKSCESDWNQPGDVVCQNLDLNPAGSLTMGLCWLGWDDSHACPVGYSLDPASSSCVPITGNTDCSFTCDPGFQFDQDGANCLVDIHAEGLVENLDYCPPGTFVNSISRRCIGSEYELDTNCPPGFFYSVGTGSCWSRESSGSCPEGYRKLADSEGCIPVNTATSPRCKSIEVNFPISEVTVKEPTRCLMDPGSPNQIVSSLKAFDSVEVAGLGEGGEWLVIINPDYEIPCWAPLSDFYLETLDLDILPIISAENGD